MARTEPKRELILANLVTTLEGINGVDPYWTTVKKVRRVPFVPTEFEGEDKPGLLIVATGEREENETRQGYQDRRDLRVGIIGVMDRPNADTGTAINRYMKDVSIAVMADVTRGGLSTMTFKTYQQDMSNLFGDLGLFEMELSITYHCDGKNE
jgi:hypothetical protein